MERNKTNDKIEVISWFFPFCKTFELVDRILGISEVKVSHLTYEDKLNEFIKLHWQGIAEKDTYRQFEIRTKQLVISMAACEQMLGGSPKSPQLCTFLRFPKAVMSMAQVIEFGARKYHPEGWRKIEDFEVVYDNAMGRHLLESLDDENDAGSKVPHVAHVASNVLIWLENKRTFNDLKQDNFLA